MQTHLLGDPAAIRNSYLFMVAADGGERKSEARFLRLLRSNVLPIIAINSEQHSSACLRISTPRVELEITL
jgi:hypothetical protein